MVPVSTSPVAACLSGAPMLGEDRRCLSLAAGEASRCSRKGSAEKEKTAGLPPRSRGISNPVHTLKQMQGKQGI